MNGPAASLCLGSGCSVPDGDGDIEDGLGGRVAVLLQLEHTVLCYFNAGVVSFLTTREWFFSPFLFQSIIYMVNMCWPVFNLCAKVAEKVRGGGVDFKKKPHNLWPQQQILIELHKYSQVGLRDGPWYVYTIRELFCVTPTTKVKPGPHAHILLHKKRCTDVKICCSAKISGFSRIYRKELSLWI